MEHEDKVVTDNVIVVARNIVNQLGDFWGVPATTRQNTNDRADQFTAAVIHDVICAVLSELLDEEMTPCRCVKCILEMIEEHAIQGVCPNCRHPLVWHEFKTVGQLEAQHEVMTCKDCDCYLEKSH